MTMFYMTYIDIAFATTHRYCVCGDIYISFAATFVEFSGSHGGAPLCGGIEIPYMVLDGTVGNRYHI